MDDFTAKIDGLHEEFERQKAEIKRRNKDIVVAARRELVYEHGFTYEELASWTPSEIMSTLIETRFRKDLEINIIGVEDKKLIYSGDLKLESQKEG